MRLKYLYSLLNCHSRESGNPDPDYIVHRVWIPAFAGMTATRSFIFVILLLAGCRSVIPARDLRSSSAPDISRIMLRKGDSVVVFNKDFGWYDKKAGIVEGVTLDSQHVAYPVASISKLETVRDYSIIPAILTASVIIGAALYLIAKLLTYTQ